MPYSLKYDFQEAPSAFAPDVFISVLAESGSENRRTECLKVFLLYLICDEMSSSLIKKSIKRGAKGTLGLIDHVRTPPAFRAREQLKKWANKNGATANRYAPGRIDFPYEEVPKAFGLRFDTIIDARRRKPFKQIPEGTIYKAEELAIKHGVEYKYSDGTPVVGPSHPGIDVIPPRIIFYKKEKK
ncbi:hypothetical protein HY991_03755 [Candidatus Micrarchaeota archaeon]|nr:hypothetical protein [Candidatus Micrarchaeota archaeon]